MTNLQKTLQNAGNWFWGYGGARLPHVDQRHFLLSCNYSRGLMFEVSPGVVSRPVDGFNGFYASQCVCDSRLRDVDALAAFQTCSASTTASNSQNWENSDNIKTPLPASAGKGLRGLKYA